MFSVFKRGIAWLLYNPQKHISQISKDNHLGNGNILGRSFKVASVYTSRGQCISIGDKNVLHCKFVFESDSGSITLGSKCFVNADTIMISRSSIEIGSYVTISWGVTITDHDSHSLNYQSRRNDIDQQLQDIRLGRNFIFSKDWSDVTSKSIVIEDDVWVGMNATILKGVKLGRGSVVAAGAVVTKDVPAFCVAAGNPATIVKRLDRHD